jgi:hypothetical protein
MKITKNTNNLKTKITKIYIKLYKLKKFTIIEKLKI